ncbi:MAG: glycosyltransferase family 39 protein [Planctomycetaceae bacterium]|nr:glycosyltransferase family 39 protein [Planctomycetaceae bacterium]
MVRQLGVVSLLICLVLAAAWAGGGQYLLLRQLWMDEVHSWLLIKEPEMLRSLQALADGVDFNPPTYFMLARQLDLLPGEFTELQLRWLSLSLMLLSIAGIFILLRRRFPVLICMASVMMMASSVHLIHQSTEIRFYPLWCATCAWLCVTLDADSVNPRWLWRPNNCLALLLAGLMTTTHYFGILTLGLICIGAMLARNRSRSRYQMIVIVAMTGGSCLVGCLPFLIGQRAALTRATWVSPATVDDSMGFLTAMFPWMPTLLCGLVFVISSALQKQNTQIDNSPTITLDHLSTVDRPAIDVQIRELAPCLMLTLMPCVIVLLSWTLQPALVVRYAVPGMLGFGAVFAVLMSRCSPGLQKMLVVASVMLLAYSVSICGNQWREIDAIRENLVRELKSLPADGPILFEDRTVSMPILHLHPELRARCSLIDFNNDQLSGDSSLRIVQRDVGRQIRKWYPEYRMQSMASLSSISTFYIVPYADPQSASLVWPASHTMTEISARIKRCHFDATLSR